MEELGGDGKGVIGALAGIGLRMSRCDGAIRGRLGENLTDKLMKAGEFCHRYGADFIVDIDGLVLKDSDQVKLGDWARLMYYDGHKVSLAKKMEDDRYDLISHHQVREQFNDKKGTSVCSNYTSDNDDEECISLGSQACFNCLYRRWTEGGFTCMHTM